MIYERAGNECRVVLRFNFVAYKASRHNRRHDAFRWHYLMTDGRHYRTEVIIWHYIGWRNTCMASLPSSSIL